MRRWIVAAGCAVVVVLCIVYYRFDPTSSSFFPPCPVHALTGLQCPSCGIQRALHCFLHGEMMAGLRYNWYLLLALPYVILVLVAEVFASERMKRLLYHRVTLMTYVATYCIWFVLRNIIGA